MTVPDGASTEIVAWLEELSERDPLARLLADEDGSVDVGRRDELLRYVEAGNIARHRKSAEEFSALAAGLLADVGFDELMVEQMEGFTPGADSDALVAARERIWWTAVAVADTDAEIARHLRETYDGILDVFVAPLRDLLAASRLRPRAGMSQSELNMILGLITDALTLRGRIDPASTPESRAIVQARMFELLTEEDLDRPEPTAESEEAAAIDRRLALNPSFSAHAMRDHVALLRLAQTDDEALLRARLRSAFLLTAPKVRATQAGRAAWRLAALTLGPLDPSERMRVQAAAEIPDPDAHPLDDLALIRALLRLEQPERAAELASALAVRIDLPAQVRAQVIIAEAAAKLDLDQPDRALELSQGVIDGGGTVSAHAAAVGANAAMALGRDDLAGEMLAHGRRAAQVGRGDYRGLVALELADSEHALRAGNAVRARDAALAAGEHLFRHGDENAAGNPWRLHLAQALVLKDRRRDALNALTEHESALGPQPLPGARAALLTARAEAEQDPEASRILREQGLALADQARIPRLSRILRSTLDAAPPTQGSVPARGSGLDGFGFSPRVRQVVELVSAGLRDSEIAEQLGISPRTVNNHVATALRATGARNRVELTRVAATSHAVAT